MLDKFSRQVYASAKSKVEAALGRALLEHRHLIHADGGKPTRGKVRAALDQAIGDALTDVISGVYDDMTRLAEEMLPEEELPEGQDDEEELEELPEAEDDEEELEELPEAEEDDENLMVADDDEPAIDSEELEKVASDLAGIKKGMLQQASRLARAGDIDSAARVKMLAKKL